MVRVCRIGDSDDEESDEEDFHDDLSEEEDGKEKEPTDMIADSLKLWAE